MWSMRAWTRAALARRRLILLAGVSRGAATAGR
jgi:hypothetical protein